MPFSFDTTIALVTNAANELSRAARDLGDEQPENEITQMLREAVDVLTYCVAELTDTRDQAAARGTSGANVTLLRDVQRDPNGMASPGADLPTGANADTIADEKAALVEQRQHEAERARLAAIQAAATPVVVVDQPTVPTATPQAVSSAKPDDAPKDETAKKK